MILISQQIVILEELLNANRDIISNHMPVFFVEKASEAIQTKGFCGAKAIKSLYNFLFSMRSTHKGIILL
jgi:hypothetical protein